MNLSAFSFYDNLVFWGTFFTRGALDSDLHVQNDFSRQIQSKNVRIYNIAFHCGEMTVTLCSRIFFN